MSIIMDGWIMGMCVWMDGWVCVCVDGGMCVCVYVIYEDISHE